jgi:hypothetical protein
VEFKKMIPTECKMPDLSDCSAERLQGQAILHVIIGDPGVNTKERFYRRLYARLVDKAIYEYGMARKALLEEIAEQRRPSEEMVRTGRQFFILAFVDHFENCINAVNRSLKLFERMKHEPIVSGVPRQLRRALEAYSTSLPDVRNTFEHMDEQIRDDRIADGQPIMLSVGGDGDRAVIGEDEVSFKDVAVTLRKLHEIGKLLFESRPSDAAAGEVSSAIGTTVLEWRPRMPPSVGGY